MSPHLPHIATRDQVLAFRLAQQHLAARLPPGALIEAARCGLQNTPPGTAALALHARVADLAPAELNQALAIDKTLLQVANPGAVAQLAAAVKAVAQPPAPQPVAPLPEIAREISGKTFVFEPNPAEMETAVLTFDESAEASLAIKQSGSEQVVRAPLGLDGVYRMSMGGHSLPQGYRGSWADAQTFVFEYGNIANNDHIIFRMRVERSRVMMTGQETAHELGVTFEGRLQKP